MLIYSKIITNISNICGFSFKENNENLQFIMRLYVWVSKYHLVRFNDFAQLYYIFKNFNNTKVSLVENLIVYFIYAARITFNPICTPSLKNNSIIYFFNSQKIQGIKIILQKIKHKKNYITTLLSSDYVIRYSPTTVSKYLHNNYINLIDILYLRKNKIFNKGRYSRNRQFYRTGVYWCLYINIIAVVGLYFWFYRFVMNFGYLWWLLFAGLASFIIAKSLNYNLFNPVNLIKSIFNDFGFFVFTLLSIKKIIISLKDFLLGWINVLWLQLNSVAFSKAISNHFIFIRSVYLYVLQFFPHFHLLKCNVINYYIYSITLNYNRVFLNTQKYKFTSIFTRELLK